MRRELPQCNFKNCKYHQDGNCVNASKYENCKLTDLHSEIAKLRVELDNAKAKNEKWQTLVLKQEDTMQTIAQEKQSYYDKLQTVKADTVKEIQTKLAMHFGTYTDEDVVKVSEVFKLLSKFSEEIMEVE